MSTMKSFDGCNCCSLTWCLDKLLLLCLLSLMCQMLFGIVNSDVLEFTADPGILQYQTPADCLSFYTLDYTGVALTCEVPVINRDYDKDYFERISSKYTKSLFVTCTNHYLMRSSLHNMSISHLQELQEFVLVGCKFSSIERETFQNCSRDLVYVTVTCEIDNIHSLTIEQYSLQPLSHIPFLNLSYNNLNTIPRGELCFLEKLEQLFLNNNNLSRITDLGFSNCGNSLHDQHCGSNIIVLDLSFNRFVSLVNNSLCGLGRLQEVSFHGNNLSEIEPRAFANLGELRYLDLSCNNISEMPSGIWNDISQLNALNLSHNHLKGGIDKTTFIGLENLQTLDLSANQIDFIESETFTNLTKLVHLSISSNFIRIIQDGTFTTLCNLMTLFLDNNIISSKITDETFIGLTSLVELMLNNNNLTEIDQVAFLQTPRLLNISLSVNRLQEIPSFRNLTNIEIIDLSDNNIEKLSANTFEGLKKLIGLKLAMNSLQEIPARLLVDLENLEVLNLSHNKLSTLPFNCFKNNSKLGFLNLSFNVLGSFGSLQDNNRLIYVDISNNYLRILDYSFFPRSLTYLNAASNRIEHLQALFNVAKNIPISYMYLSHNKLTRIRSTSLPPTLQILDMSFNNISYIDAETFKPMKQLKIVSLQSNGLHHISKMSLEVYNGDLKARPVFHFSGNHIVCDCNMAWITSINDMPNSEYGYIEDLKYLHCWLPVRRRFPDRLKRLIDVTQPEFECEFQNHTFSTAVCEKITSSTTNICDAVCPNNCMCWHTQSWDTVTVDCSNKSWTSVEKNIPELVTILYLDGNSITYLDDNSFENYSRLEELLLNRTGIKSIGVGTFQTMPKLKKLSLEYNNLVTLLNGTFNGLNALNELILSSNSLSYLNLAVFQPLYSLKRLELQNNNLVNVPVWMFDTATAITTLKLGNNSWTCNCSYMVEYWKWLQNTKISVLDSQDIFCYFKNDSTAKLPLIGFNDTECVDNTVFTVAWHQPVVAIILILFVVITITIVLVYIYHHEMQVLIYSRYGFRLFYKNVEMEDDKKTYDIFMSYSNDDEEFVVRQLLPDLEEIEVPYKLCLHQRDFAAGAYITESILEAVEYSRRTIIVLTNSFIQSEWCRFEFMTAHRQMLKDRCIRIIMIIKDDIPTDLDPEMKLYLKTNTYLKWNDKLFWKKLYFALPDKKKKVNT